MFSVEPQGALLGNDASFAVETDKDNQVLSSRGLDAGGPREGGSSYIFLDHCSATFSVFHEPGKF